MAYVPSLTAQAIAERKTWQFKVLNHCRENAEWHATGLIVTAMLGRFKNPPCWHPNGIKIDLQGVVRALYKASVDRSWTVTVMLDSVADLVANFRRLADEIKLSDVERYAMFDELRKWVVEDERAKSEI